jgi:toxin ParE1/3/4
MSSRRIVQRRQARHDAIEQAVAIAANNPDAAGRFFEAIDQTLQLLAEMPEMGAARVYRDPALQGLRMHPVRRFPQHLLFYLPLADGIELIRVLHGKRNIERLFQPEPRPEREGEG